MKTKINKTKLDVTRATAERNKSLAMQNKEKAKMEAEISKAMKQTDGGRGEAKAVFNKALDDGKKELNKELNQTFDGVKEDLSETFQSKDPEENTEDMNGDGKVDEADDIDKEWERADAEAKADRDQHDQERQADDENDKRLNTEPEDEQHNQIIEKQEKAPEEKKDTNVTIVVGKDGKVN